MSSPHLPSPSPSIPPSSLAAARSSSQLQLLPASSSSSLLQQAAAAPDSSASSASSFPPPPTPSSLSSDWSPLTGSTLSPPEAKDDADSPPIDAAESLTRSQFITHAMVEDIKTAQRAEHRGQQRRGAAEQRPAAFRPSLISSSLPPSGAAAPAAPVGSIAASSASSAAPPAVSTPTASAAASSAAAGSGSWQSALHHVITSQQLEAQPAERKEEAGASDEEKQPHHIEAEDDAADGISPSDAVVVAACDGSPASVWSAVCSRLSSVGSFMTAHPAVPLSLLSLSLFSLGFFLGRRYQRRQQQFGLLAPLDRLQRLHMALEQAARGAGAAGGAVISSGVGWVRGVCGAAPDRDIPGVIVTVKFL